jgi:AcrR family transcriptional regulator
VVREVLDATLEELAETGYRALRTEAVAARAGVAKTTVYRRWPTREALVGAALAASVEEWPTLDPDAPVRDTMRTYLKHLAERFHSPRGRGLSRMLFTEGMDAELAALVRPLREARRRHVARALRAAIARGEVAPELDVETAMDALVGTVHHRVLLRHERADDAFIERLLALVLGPAPAAPARPRAR